ncbi:Beta-glucosidase 24 [Linum grandiflorum]
MANPKLLFLLFLLVELVLQVLGDNVRAKPSKNITRSYFVERRRFPSDFLFGVTSSSYQHEGATWEDGRRPSIWDAYTHAHPEKIINGSTGDVAADFYHLYKDDIKLAKQIGFNTFRFSLSWSRILPKGKLSGGINKKGIQFYNNVTNEILAQGLEPFVSLIHMDIPLALQDEYGGFLNKQIVSDFRDYANLCFKEFGDRVKYWTTINEPYTFARGGFDQGDLAPGRCTSAKNWTCDDGGNSSTEPYIVGHNQLLAHATAVQLYRQKYQAVQKGIIGMAMNVDWFFPYTASERDKKAAKRALDFNFKWFMDPMYHGDYPKSMKHYVGDRLPKFSEQESKLLKGSFDYIGINYYTSRYVLHGDGIDSHHPNGIDSRVLLTFVRDGKVLGKKTAAPWMNIYGKGLCNLLLHIKDTYQNPSVYITENGVAEAGNYMHPPNKAPPDDVIRISFIQDHLEAIRRALRYGVNVKGYMVWTLVDGFEWLNGYTMRFGLHYVDFDNPSVRIRKLSAIWLDAFLHKGNLIY